MSARFVLSLLIFITGYAVLASMVIAQRNLLGYVGDGSDMNGLIVGLMGVSFVLGLHAAGRPEPALKPLRLGLIKTYTLVLALLGFGLSTLVIDSAFYGLTLAGDMFGLNNRLLLAGLYCFIFLMPALYLLGQALHRLTWYLPNGDTALPAALAGALLGGLGSPLLLMAYWGTHGAVLVIAALLALAIALLLRAVTLRTMLLPLLILILCVGINSRGIFSALGVYYQNAHNTVRITSLEDGKRVLMQNNFPVAEFKPDNGDIGLAVTKAEELLLPPAEAIGLKLDILVIGAGGFTFGLKDTHNTYTYIDADPELKRTAEEFFLGQTLTPNKTIETAPVRAFMAAAVKAKKNYDLIYLTPYTSNIWLPETLVTQDFFEQARKLLKPAGVLGAMYILSPNFSNDYSLTVDVTFHSVFPAMARIPVGATNVWDRNPLSMRSLIYVGYNEPLTKFGKIYTDERSSVMWDKPFNRKY